MSDTKPLPNRWTVAIMGTLLQVCLGTVYAWSYFQKPIVTTYGWSNSQTAWTFSLAICFLGLSAAWGGINMVKYGPRKLACAGGILFATGYLIGAAGLMMQNMYILWLGYGVIGGCGLGLGYVTPVATAAKWFPDKKGFITGMVVMGFGFGALIMSKVIAPVFMSMTGGNLVQVFLYIGILMYILTLPAASYMINPPAGYCPPGFTPPVATAASQAADNLTAGQCIGSSVFYRMWLIFFCSITAGIMFIGFQSPMIQDLLRESYAAKYLDPAALTAALAGAGATLIGISSIFNGVGRFFWGGLSDKIGRIQAFRLILVSQVLVFVGLVYIKSPIIFGALVCYVLLCYGGGFGTMPSFVMDVFGAPRMAAVYGTILTAWAAGGVVGPQVAAIIKDTAGASAGTYTFYTGAGFLIVGALIALTLSNNRYQGKTASN